MKDIERAIDAVGGLPVVVKVTQGTQGQGVFLRHTLRDCLSPRTISYGKSRINPRICCRKPWQRHQSTSRWW